MSNFNSHSNLTLSCFWLPWKTTRSKLHTVYTFFLMLFCAAAEMVDLFLPTILVGRKARKSFSTPSSLQMPFAILQRRRQKRMPCRRGTIWPRVWLATLIKLAASSCRILALCHTFVFRTTTPTRRSYTVGMWLFFRPFFSTEARMRPCSFQKPVRPPLPTCRTPPLPFFLTARLTATRVRITISCFWWASFAEKRKDVVSRKAGGISARVDMALTLKKLPRFFRKTWRTA